MGVFSTFFSSPCLSAHHPTLDRWVSTPALPKAERSRRRVVGESSPIGFARASYDAAMLSRFARLRTALQEAKRNMENDEEAAAYLIIKNALRRPQKTRRGQALPSEFSMTPLEDKNAATYSAACLKTSLKPRVRGAVLRLANLCPSAGGSASSRGAHQG